MKNILNNKEGFLLDQTLIIDEFYSLYENRNPAAFFLNYQLMRLKSELFIKALRELQPKYNRHTEILFINGDKRKVISLNRMEQKQC